jgi:long-subunit acyl-CoA synthetase (AMP-forming)
MDKGYLFIVGRKKELIITSGGENIAPVPIENNLLKELTDIEYAIVIGNNKKFLSVLLFPYEKYFDKYENIDNEMTEYYNNKITEINKLSQSNAHKIQKWKIILCKFTVGKELTPTYKIKRDYIHKKFNIEINSLYENE